MENIKMFNLPLAKLEKYIQLENPEILKNYYDQGVSVAVIAAHYGNWEWLLGLRKDVPHHSIGIFKSLNNKYFNRFFTRHRSEYGTEIVNMREVPRVLTRYFRNKQLTLTVYIADQSPVWEEIQYWTMFLNQLTPVYLGPAKLAGKFNMAIVYFRVKVKERNRYSVEAIPVCDNAAEMKETEITEKHLKLLEEDIRNNPEFWLWSHRRWKLTEKRMKQEKSGVFRFEGHWRKN
jgi:KDO2-lipid IV(A) lauroyltransferase